FTAVDIVIILNLANIINVSFNYWMITFLIIVDLAVLVVFLFYKKKFKIGYPVNPFGLFLSFSVLYQMLMYVYLIHGSTNGEIFGQGFAILAQIAALFSVFKTLVDYPYQKLKNTVSEQSKTFKNVTTLINHDVASQLAVAAGAIDLSLDAEHNIFLEKAASSIDYALTLLRRLIKIGREIIRSEKKCIDVYVETLTIIDEIKQSNDFPEKNANIICEKFDLKIYGYDILLRIIYNLIINAIRHSSKKNVNIWIRMLDCRKTTKDYKLIVEDDGDGIPLKRKETLLHKPVASEEGFGMSLYLASNLITEQFDGTITIEDRVENDSSKGAKLIISLPKQKKECRRMLKLHDS
ncbi:MAG: sensor histidine kinase, partial [Candidatus Heimdallarchaeaceae archaeon]